MQIVVGQQLFAKAPPWIAVADIFRYNRALMNLPTAGQSLTVLPLIQGATPETSYGVKRALRLGKMRAQAYLRILQLLKHLPSKYALLYWVEPTWV